ncbi:hypothetical protein OPV22_035218 [Ensete ventricosum]|uniref:Uncharacterized protein n=1 Tax=Ensete ventricosum TaxID=4639 RepID=A0AAX5JZZ5_ENSVE|nr:hypothetical protein OPV22_035218 [Ensete ventricosum]
MGNIFMEDIGIAGTTLGAPGRKSDLGAGKANFKSVVKDRSIGSSLKGKGMDSSIAAAFRCGASRKSPEYHSSTYECNSPCVEGIRFQFDASIPVSPS